MSARQQKEIRYKTHVSCTTVPLVGERSEDKREGALRMRKVTSKTLFHQNCILSKENDVKFVGEL